MKRVIDNLMGMVIPGDEKYTWLDYVAGFCYWLVMLTVLSFMIYVIIIGVYTMSFDFVIG